MSGLRALVAAARTSTPRLRPRPVSVFETAPAAPQDQDSEVASIVEAPGPTVQPRPPLHHSADRTVVGRVPDVAPQPVPPHSSGPEPATEPVVAARPPAPATPVVRTVVVPAPPVVADAAPARRRTPTLPAGRPAHTEPPVVRRPPPEPAQSTARRTEPTPPTGVGVLVPPPLPSALAGTGVRVTQPSRRSQTAPAAVPVQRSEPEVHVSIGRIEVIANPAPAAEPAPSDGAARRGVVGLDDYLTQRGRR